jgi:hypothetical protein
MIQSMTKKGLLSAESTVKKHPTLIARQKKDY